MAGRFTLTMRSQVLFPVYFLLCSVITALLMVISPPVLGEMFGRPQLVVLGSALASSLANLWLLEPRTTAVMKERAALEKMAPSVASGMYPQGKELRLKELGAAFGKWHGLSSLLNLIMFGALVSHGWVLVGRGF